VWPSLQGRTSNRRLVSDSLVDPSPGRLLDFAHRRYVYSWEKAADYDDLLDILTFLGFDTRAKDTYSWVLPICSMHDLQS
jgi:hypothetical protein